MRLPCDGEDLPGSGAEPQGIASVSPFDDALTLAEADHRVAANHRAVENCGQYWTLEVTELEAFLLSEVAIERFKAAFKPSPISLGAFNVVIGRNGSGKSTLLEALQWLDATIRRDAREACDRYYGISDLINLRSQTAVPYFKMRLTWKGWNGEKPLRYSVKVAERNGVAVIAEEQLVSLRPSGTTSRSYVTTGEGGERQIHVSEKDETNLSVQEPDRLAIGLFGSLGSNGAESALSFLHDFWARAVFLRLSPNRLAAGSLATRKSFEPLLDEEGQTLPALLNELGAEAREELVEQLRDILPGIRNVEVSRADLGRDTRVNYNLKERMPYQGRTGRKHFPIPAWMLSEGTRRITAILALLVRDPPPALLCIEEVDNGLDPWTVQSVLNHLRSVADRGTQVILTTHSPWLLDHVPMASIIQVRRLEGDTRYERFADRPEIQAFDPSIPAGTRYVRDETSADPGSAE